MKVFLNSVKADNAKLHRWGGWLMGVCVIIHVWSLMLPSIFDAYSNVIVNNEPLSWPAQVSLGMSQISTKTKTANWGLDDLWRLCWMTIMFCLLFPLSMSIRARATNYSLMMWLHTLLGIGFFIDSWRRRTHPHVWLCKLVARVAKSRLAPTRSLFRYHKQALSHNGIVYVDFHSHSGCAHETLLFARFGGAGNTPVVALYIADRLSGLSWYRFARALPVKRYRLDRDYQVLMWKHAAPKTKELRSAADSYYLKQRRQESRRSQSLSRFAWRHPFTCATILKTQERSSASMMMINYDATVATINVPIHIDAPSWVGHRFALDEILEEHNYFIGRHDNDGRRMTLTAKMSPSGIASTTLVQNAGEKEDEDTAPSIPSPLKAMTKSGELAGWLDTLAVGSEDTRKPTEAAVAWSLGARESSPEAKCEHRRTWAPSTEHGRISKIRVTRRRSTVLRQFNTSRQTLSRGNRGVQQQELEFDICAVARVHQKQKNVRGHTEQTEVTEGVVWEQLAWKRYQSAGACGRCNLLMLSVWWSKVAKTALSNQLKTCVQKFRRTPETLKWANAEGGSIPMDVTGPYHSEFGLLKKLLVPGNPHPVLVIATGAGACLALETMSLIRGHNQGYGLKLSAPVTVLYSTWSKALLRFVSNNLMAEIVPGLTVQIALTGLNPDDVEMHDDKQKLDIQFIRFNIQSCIKQITDMDTHVFFCGVGSLGKMVQKICNKRGIRYFGSTVE